MIPDIIIVAYLDMQLLKLAVVKASAGSTLRMWIMYSLSCPYLRCYKTKVLGWNSQKYNLVNVNMITKKVLSLQHLLLITLFDGAG